MFLSLPHPRHHRAGRVALVTGPGREHHCTCSLSDWTVFWNGRIEYNVKYLQKY